MLVCLRRAGRFLSGRSFGLIAAAACGPACLPLGLRRILGRYISFVVLRLMCLVCTAAYVVNLTLSWLCLEAYAAAPAPGPDRAAAFLPHFFAAFSFAVPPVQ
jgi:hypothetical protein